MRKIRVVNGSTILSDKAMELYPYAIQYYGDKYKSIVDSALDKTIIFEWHNEPKEEVFRQTTGIKVSAGNFNNTQIKEGSVNGFHISNIIPNFGIQHVVAVKLIGNTDDVSAVLAHELYGHAVCSEKNPVVPKNGMLFNRDGINISGLMTKKVYNEQANEGMIEYIAKNIMSLYKKGYSRPGNAWVYNEAVIVASIMFKYIGKEKMLDLLTLNQGAIEDLFDSSNPESWANLALELEKKHNKIDIDDHIDEFVKRYKYNR